MVLPNGLMTIATTPPVGGCGDEGGSVDRKVGFEEGLIHQAVYSVQERGVDSHCDNKGLTFLVKLPSNFVGPFSTMDIVFLAGSHIILLFLSFSVMLDFRKYLAEGVRG